MIISHKHKFIFIKTRKTAGTSIEVFLSQQCGENDVVTPINPHVEPHVARNYRGYWNPTPELVENKLRGARGTLRNLAAGRKFYNHIPARLVRQRIPSRIWNNYYKFCVDRNPWDKTLSHYHMVRDRAGKHISLEEYVSNGPFCINYGNYTDSAGHLIVDKVIRYEDLTDELHHLFYQLGIPFDGALGVKAKSGHRKDKRPYREVFTEEQKLAIQKAFAKEIALHGYTF